MRVLYSRVMLNHLTLHEVLVLRKSFGLGLGLRNKVMFTSMLKSSYY